MPPFIVVNALVSGHRIDLFKKDLPDGITFETVIPKWGLASSFAVLTACGRRIQKHLLDGKAVFMPTGCFNVSKITPGFCRAFDRLMLKMGAVQIVCDCESDRTYRSDTVSLGQSEDLEYVVRLASMRQAVDNHMNYVRSMNINGRVQGKWLLVGDVTNPRFESFDHWPWHDDKASARFIGSVLDDLQVSEFNLCWANANPRNADGRDDLALLLKERPSLTVIALGTNAVKGLAKIGVTPDSAIPHPAYALRFNQRKQFSHQLEKALR